MSFGEIFWVAHGNQSLTRPPWTARCFDSRCPRQKGARQQRTFEKPEGLLLPGSLLMAIGAELLAALMLINFCFPTFF